MTTESEYLRFLELRIKEAKALDKLLTSSGCCVICFNSDPLELEEHHLAGRKNSDITITVCGSHHAKLSRMQRSWPEDSLEKGFPTVEQREALLFRGLADVARVKSDYLFSKVIDS